MAFTTYILFENGVPFREETPEDQVKDTIMRLLRGPAAQAGMIKEFRIVDQMDNTVFLARDNEIIFPTKEDVEAALKAG
jgi:hypothetical protein